MSLTRLLEKNRKDEDKVLDAGTYGIGGARMLNCTFRYLTAEGGWDLLVENTTRHGNHFKNREGGFDLAFIAKLRAHHALEA